MITSNLSQVQGIQKSTNISGRGEGICQTVYKSGRDNRKNKIVFRNTGSDGHTFLTLWRLISKSSSGWQNEISACASYTLKTGAGIRGRSLRQLLQLSQVALAGMLIGSVSNITS